MLQRPVTFDTNIKPTFSAAQAVDKVDERRLDNKKTLWSEERVAGQDKDKQILVRGAGSGDGDFLRLQWIEVLPV